MKNYFKSLRVDERKRWIAILLAVACMPLATSFALAQQRMVINKVFDREKYEDTFAFGADISWLSQQESWGTVYNNRAGRKTDLMKILRDEEGINAVRFRVWVNPSGGWSGKQDVINLCKRAHAMKMKIMIDFHYSDTWADPGKQGIPAAWKDQSVEALSKNVYDHTFDILNSLKQLGIVPKWVQIGNETKRGMLWETGRTSSTQGYKNFAALINSGYDAIKAVDSTMLAIVHLPDGHDNSLYRSMFDKLKQYGAKYDVIGMSAYPRWSHLDITTDAQITSTINMYMTNVRDMKSRYGKPVMIVETGHYNNKPEDANKFFAEFMKSLINAGALGCFYWEPEAMSGYELGAWDPNTKQASIAMDAFKGYKYVKVSDYVKMSGLTPVESQVCEQGKGIQLKVNAKAGSTYTKVAKMNFYLNKLLKGTVTEATNNEYVFSPDSLAEKVYAFHVVAYDDQGNSQSSDTVNFIVGKPLMLDEDSPAWGGMADGIGGVESQNAQYTGSGYITPNGSRDAKTSWKVNFPEAGRYTIIVRYASTARSSVVVAIDDTKLTSATFNPTGALDKWMMLSRTLTVNVPGTYDLTLSSSTSTYLPNIDYIGLLSPNRENPASAVGEASGIRELKADDRSDVMYDLMGRRIQTPTKQIYIKNGKLYLQRGK